MPFSRAHHCWTHDGQGFLGGGLPIFDSDSGGRQDMWGKTVGE